MGKKKVPALLVIFFLSVSLLILSLFSKQRDVVAPSEEESITAPAQEASKAPPALRGKDDIYKTALNLFIAKKQQGLDLKDGPCLGEIAPDWVLDIAHNPRIAADDKPENQCPQLKAGTAHHFIELDPSGKLIKSN